MATQPGTIEKSVSPQNKSKNKQTLSFDDTLKRLDVELPTTKLSTHEKISLRQTLFRLHK
ncbi:MULTISPECIES: hypothetical protein [unclassified Mesorhizobium]|uniref:hypothetical protein n=1 Tax=unclassified Mesorhizobium TaxID=325217 RepID=UPI0003CF48AA|nr:hypothetical protein [Mesorhizobium sp. LSHC420B00]ESX66059.1 hypothetical protein X759_28120 [Mesorhizobium sp. LSHC420B00]